MNIALPRFMLYFNNQQAHTKKSASELISDTNFYCTSCKKKFTHHGLYRKRLRDAHKMNLPHISRRKSRDIKPDLNDPNFYCKPCDQKYPNCNIYRRYFRLNHNMVAPYVKNHH